MSLNIPAFFDQHEREYLQFDRIIAPNSTRPDLHAFLLLEELSSKANLSPRERPLISAVDHDKIYLDVDPEAISASATEQDLIDLIRCGVSYSKTYHCFYLFV